MQEGDVVRVEGGDGLWVIKEVGKEFLQLSSQEFEWIEISVYRDEIIDVVDE